VLLRHLGAAHGQSGHAAIDATFSTAKTLHKHYCRRTNYRVQTLKATALVDTQKAKQFWTFTVRPRNATTHSSAGRSPAATRTTSPASLPTKATTGWIYAKNSAKTA